MIPPIPSPTSKPSAFSGVISFKYSIFFVSNRSVIFPILSFNFVPLYKLIEINRKKEIDKIEFKDETWGSVLFLEYEKNGKKENFQYSVAQDWVKYPLKEPTKFLKVDWEPFVQYIKERQ